MWRKALLPQIAALLLAGALFPQPGLAASAQFGVSLVVRQSCEVRTEPGSTHREPAVNCIHGQSFAVSRHAQQLQNTSTPAHSLARTAIAGMATEMWVVTF